MNSTSFILVSPGPVDGYPPVQYQARLLAIAGHSVEVLTSPLTRAEKSTAFSCSGVRVSCISAKNAFAGQLRRNAAYASALLGSRLRSGKRSIEICFDPIGIFISDFTPLKPQRRVAHLHELLQDTDSFLEKRLERTLKSYQLVVVPDESRSEHTAKVLSLRARPLVIENYPTRAARPLEVKASTRFEVVYCGSVGLHQKLDLVIRSIRQWPADADFVIIGNDSSPTAATLRDLAKDEGVVHRVHFLGWMENSVAEERLASADLAVALLDGSFEQFRTALGASNKRYQYMKAGLPQVGDQNPGVTELIEGQGIGTCLKVHDPNELATVVAAYHRDPARRQAEGKRAFQLHQERYNYEAVFGRLLQRLEDLP